jgi:dihydrodipicolinate synthase/N-acetylneuraminate lyase
VKSKDAFRGLIPALITPMREDFSVDYDSFDNYLKWIMPQNIIGLAINVDTGEGPALSSDERIELLKISRKRLSNSKLLVAGLSATSTSSAVEQAKHAKEAGADVMLLFPNPAFRGYPPSPDAMLSYFSEIADKANIDLMLFQLQDALGGIELDEASLRILASLESVVAIKEATFNFSKYKRTLDLFREIEADTGREIAFLTGNDNFILESFLWGCDGALIGAGAQDTTRIAACFDACQKDDWVNAIGLAKQLQPLVDLVFSHPVRDYRARTKACLFLQGVIESKTVRPPLVEVTRSQLDLLRKALKAAGLEVNR